MKCVCNMNVVLYCPHTTNFLDFCVHWELNLFDKNKSFIQFADDLIQ